MPANIRFPRSSRAHEGERERLGAGRLPTNGLVVPLVPLGPWSDMPPARERLSASLERWEGHARKTLSALHGAFEMKPPVDAAKLVDERLVLAEGGRELEVFRPSGAFRWIRRVEGEDDDSVRAEAPDDPIAKADAYLSSRGLADGRATAVGVHETTVTRRTKDGGFVTHAIATHVEYKFRIQGLPVLGPGGKMRVTFGKDGEVAGVFKFFREPGPSAEALLDPRDVLTERLAAMRPLHDMSHLRRRLHQDPSFARVCTKKAVSVRDVSLGYYAAPPRFQQDALVPVFAVDVRTRVKWTPRYSAVRYVSACRHLAEDWDRLGAGVFAHVRR